MTYYPEYRFFGFGVNDPEPTEILGEDWEVTCPCDDTEQVVTMRVATVCFDSGDNPNYCGTWTCSKCDVEHKDDEEIRPYES